MMRTALGRELALGAIAEFEVTGAASPARVRAAGLMDGLAAAVVAMILLPQPVIRQAVMAAVPGPAGVGLFVASLAAVVLATMLLYIAFSAVTWGRTPGMYLLDLGLDAPTNPTLPEALGFGLGWVIALVPALLGVKAAFHPECGFPARLSGVPTRSTASG